MDYQALKKRVEKAGGIRLASHGSLRNQIVDLVVAEWPKSCKPENLAEVLHARVSLVVRRRKSKAYAMFLVWMMVRPVVNIAVEWYLEKPGHRVLMEGWRAKKAQDL